MNTIDTAQVTSDPSPTQCPPPSVEEHLDAPRPNLLHRIAEAVRAAHTASVPF